MSLPAGTHKLGPENGTLSVRTGRTGAAAKAGHDLLIHVADWRATLRVGDEPAQTNIVLAANATSLRVQDGTGGMQPLEDEDKASIQQTIDDEILKGGAIEFRSTAVDAVGDGSRLRVRGQLTLIDRTAPLSFVLAGRGRRHGQRQRRRQAIGLGDPALHRVVRRTPGRRPGRGGDRRRPDAAGRRAPDRPTSGSRPAR